jgi:photosystem II stability/assembly factor-like uncharacterized protein
LRKSYRRIVFAGLMAITLGAIPVAGAAFAPWRAMGSPVANPLKGVKLVNSCIAYAVGESREYFANSPTPLLKSTNGGATWHSVAPPNLLDTTLNKVDAINGLPAIEVVGEPTEDFTLSYPPNTPGHGRVLISMNGGASWADNTNILPALKDVNDIEDHEGVSQKPGSSSSWMIASSTRNATTGAIYGRVYRTTNGGLSYQTVFELPLTANDSGADVTWVDPLHAWFISDKGKVYVTGDGGDNWSLQADFALTSFYLERVKFNDLAHGVVVGEGGIEWWTNDSGASWHPGSTFTTDNLQDAGWRDSASVWAIGDPPSEGAFPFIGVSTDGGKTFSRESSPVAASLNSISIVHGTVPAQALATGGNGTVLKRGFFCGT